MVELSLWPTLPSTADYTLELEEATPSNNVIKGMHFQAYRSMRKRWNMRVFLALGGRRPAKPIEKAFLVVERYCVGAGLDWDNAYGGLKPLLDCLVSPSDKNPDGLGLIRDDNPSNMPFPPFVKQFSTKQKQSKTLVRIYNLDSLAQLSLTA